MPETSTFEKNKRDLYQKRCRELKERLEVLSLRVHRGRYEAEELSELASILRSLRFDLLGNDTLMSSAMGVSGATISQTYSGKSRPKYASFMKMLHGAQRIIEQEIDRARQTLRSVDLADSPQDLTGSDHSEIVRIRSKRSNLFLSDEDLVRVQNLAKESKSNISTVIRDALAQYVSTAPKKLAAENSRTQFIIENRIEVIRYSNAIISALEEALNYNVDRHHNSPPPDLRLEDAEYLAEIRSLIFELRRLNALLEKPIKSNASAARKEAAGFGKHMDKFLSSYAGSLGKGAAGLTVAAVAGLLYQAGAGELVEGIWKHLKHR